MNLSFKGQLALIGLIILVIITIILKIRGEL